MDVHEKIEALKTMSLTTDANSDSTVTRKDLESFRNSVVDVLYDLALQIDEDYSSD